MAFIKHRISAPGLRTETVSFLNNFGAVTIQSPDRQTLTIRVLHIDTERTWRGGENQILELIKGLKTPDVVSYLVAPPDSEVLKRMAPYAKVVGMQLGTLQVLKAVREISRLCLAERIDIIDAQTSRAHALAVLVKRRVPSLRLVVHRRVDYIPTHTPFSRFKYLTRGVDRYVAISEAVKEILVNYGVASSRIAVVRSAVSANDTLTLDRATARAQLAES